MKVCINCKNKVRDTDTYCRNYGCYMQKNAHYILINVTIAFLFIAIVGLIALFIASYMILK